MGKMFQSIPLENWLFPADGLSLPMNFCSGFQRQATDRSRKLRTVWEGRGGAFDSDFRQLRSVSAGSWLQDVTLLCPVWCQMSCGFQQLSRSPRTSS